MSGKSKQKPKTSENKGDAKVKKLKDSIHEIVQDLITNETAILSNQETQSESYDVMAYSKVELEGDSFQLMDKTSAELIQLNKALITSTNQNRKAIWKFIIKALS